MTLQNARQNSSENFPCFEDDIFLFLSAGNGYIEGKELDDFLVELVTSINKEDVGSEVGTIDSVVVIYY